jgi:phosphatidate cytidylyltransferase
MLKDRIITTIWMVPILCALIWFGEPYFTIAAVVVGFLAATEFFRLTKGVKAQALTVFGIIWTLLLIAIRNPTVISWITPHFNKELLLPGIITAGMAVSLVLLLTRKQKQGAFTDWSWTLAEIMYIGWFLGYFISLRALDSGRNWVFLAILATAGSDITAYFIGSAFGKHKLAPSISPGKTWEGSIAGVIGAVGISLLFLLPTALRLDNYVNWWQMVIIALAVSISGQLGDLVESLFKRNTGAKDSGTILPGHGGVLDRMDSAVFAVITVYYIVMLFKLY